MPYPKNFAVRLILCLLLMYALWFGTKFVMVVLIKHEAFTPGTFDFIVPAVCGVAQALSWKPKEDKSTGQEKPSDVVQETPSDDDKS